jgi:radical SAM-linked protein
MSAAPVHREPAPAAPRPRRMRAALEYALTGDLRYLAHHDELRMLTRALVRAGWPLAYSGGFNPRPRLTLPLPRNLGVAAECQVAVVDLAEPRPSGELAKSLAGQLPGGCVLHRVMAPAPSATPHPRGVVYEIDLDSADLTGLADRCAALLAQPAIVVERESAPGRPTRPIDIRPYLIQLALTAGSLRMELAFVEQRTARPAEVLTALGLAAARCTHRLRRAAVHWDMDIAGPCVGPAMHERNDFDDEEDHEESAPPGK